MPSTAVVRVRLSAETKKAIANKLHSLPPPRNRFEPTQAAHDSMLLFAIRWNNKVKLFLKTYFVTVYGALWQRFCDHLLEIRLINL